MHFLFFKFRGLIHPRCLNLDMEMGFWGVSRHFLKLPSFYMLETCFLFASSFFFLFKFWPHKFTVSCTFHNYLRFMSAHAGLNAAYKQTEGRLKHFGDSPYFCTFELTERQEKVRALSRNWQTGNKVSPLCELPNIQMNIMADPCGTIKRGEIN